MAESNLSPQAPLDLGRLEKEAKHSATKYVANLLQRPDQLERVDQYRRRIARKKASVEAMLKTAVQSQLDGVRTGLNQLQSALHDVHEIKQSLDQVEEIYKTLKPLHQTLKNLSDENKNFCQLASAMENLKHIFTVPESVRKTEELINDGKLLQSHKHLIELEMARDDLLLELHKQPNQSPTDFNMLQKYFASVEKLSESLGKQLWIILQRTLISVRREPTLIVTALRIIEREEKLDTVYLEKSRQNNGFMPPGRPKRWKEKCFQTLLKSIENRIEGNQAEDREVNKMWLVRHLEITRQLMIEDLKVVYSILPAVFPPSYNITYQYTWMYHKSLSKRLTDLIQQGLEGNEFVTLLTWINSYDSPELMKHPDLKIDTKVLGPLLDNNMVDDLQNRYLSNMKQNIQEWTRNTLTSEVRDWHKDEAPDQDGEGNYITSLPVIIFQMMEQNLQVAGIIGESLILRVLELFVQVLGYFAEDYKGMMESYRDRHLKDRKEPKYYLFYMIANTNNLLTFGDYMKQLRKRYLKTEFDKEEEEETNIRKDRFQVLNERFVEIAKIGCSIILEEVFIDLKTSNCFTDLVTKTWTQSSQAIEVISATWQDYFQDFVHLKQKILEELVSKALMNILQEYLKAILSKKLTFKTYDERKLVAEKMCKEADDLKKLFTKYGASKQTDMFSVLQMMAEVIKLKDTSMLSLEITGLVKKHPDIRMEQLISLMLCRGDMSRSDARQMVLDTIGEEDPLKPKPKGIFSDLV
ncbi:hypothetical protein CHS0354_032215 [Potamilus streckersoni]|uniref:Exocyst complex component Sec6 n=1 Tax=Potamilus streckersoni TaxID=2493646 RepID=A0AAE0VFJ6_9BIVA|nr:hypothetical protein CHS0354_032215 [Potamilus streckersoni]